MTSLNPEESPVRAGSEARELAYAVLDFRADTGQWPVSEDGNPDLKPLLGRRAARRSVSTASAPGEGLNGLGGRDTEKVALGREKSWVREIPLDPWGGAYRVYYSGTRVAILSSGPNGRNETDADQLWSRPGDINPAAGDDVCVVLDLEQDGGS